MPNNKARGKERRGKERKEEKRKEHSYSVLAAHRDHVKDFKNYCCPAARLGPGDSDLIVLGTAWVWELFSNFSGNSKMPLIVEKERIWEKMCVCVDRARTHKEIMPAALPTELGLPFAHSLQTALHSRPLRGVGHTAIPATPGY